MKKLVTALAALGVASWYSFAAPIVPTSYSLSAHGEIGSYTYYDDTGHQITDGIIGADNWSADLGNGPAYEWVGWSVANPTITFFFNDPVTISTVDIGLNHSESGRIYIPGQVRIGGTAFSVSPSALDDGKRGFLSFNGNWSGTTLEIILSDNGGDLTWIFVDEIKFGDTAPVPEPSTYLAGLSALGMLGLFGWRSRK